MKRFGFVTFFLVLIASLSTTSKSMADASDAPKILSVSLLNPDLSAGDQLDIRVKALPGAAPILTNSGTNFYLGFIPHNVFPQSEALNRSLTPIGLNEFKVADLVVNRFAEANYPSYTIETFTISDIEGRQTTLYANSTVPFYYDGYGNETDIPVMRFTLRENPLADTRGPLIHSLRLDKDEYGPGEEIIIDLEATDEIAGVFPNSLAIASTSTILLESSQGTLEKTGNNRYQIRGIRLKTDLTNAPETTAIINLIILDHALNWGGVYAPTYDADHYINAKGEQTTVEVARFKIRKN